jgi:hypothetical protein
MTPRQLARIAAALATLLVLWGLAEMLGSGSDTTTARFDLPKLTSADVDSVKIFRATDTLTLAKQADTWLVNGHLASNQAVTDLFNGFKDTSRVELIAQSATSHAQLGVDSSAGKRVELIKGAQLLASVIVGGRGPGWQGVYARRPGDDHVYLIRADLGNVVERQLDDWRDKLVAAVEPDSVREVRVQLGRGGYTLRHSDAGWRFATGAAADSGEVRRMLEQYRNLQGGGFPTEAQADSLDFRRPNRRVTLAGPSAPLAELLFDSTASWWYVRRAEGGTVYRVESWRLPQLFPADTSLRAQADTTKASG